MSTKQKAPTLKSVLSATKKLPADERDELAHTMKFLGKKEYVVTATAVCDVKYSVWATDKEDAERRIENDEADVDEWTADEIEFHEFETNDEVDPDDADESDDDDEAHDADDSDSEKPE